MKSKFNMILIILFFQTALASPVEPICSHKLSSPQLPASVNEILSLTNQFSDTCIECKTSDEALAAAHQKVVLKEGNDHLIGLAKALLQNNMDHFYVNYNMHNNLLYSDGPQKKASVYRPDCEIKDIRKKENHPRYPYFEAALKCTSEDGNNFDDFLEFRSNGHAAFLSKSYRISGRSHSQKFFMTYFDSNGFIKSHDHTAVVIQDLNQLQTVSRTMPTVEYERWQTGKLNDIKDHPAYTQFGDGRLRTFFALNYFEYHPDGRKTTVITQLPKSLLVDLYRRDHLVANTYEDSINYPLDGMAQEARTSFGIEFELVVLDEEGRRKIHPFMQKVDRAIRH